MGTYNGFLWNQRMKAQRWLNQQWKLGTLPKPSRCVACGQAEGRFDAHAEDYSEPFGPQTQAFPLCFRCHMLVHCRFRSSTAFWHYVRMLEFGWQYPPVIGGFPAIQREHLWAPRAAPPAGALRWDPPLGDPSVLRRIGLGEFAPHPKPHLGLV
jgi:hypothetical protein